MTQTINALVLFAGGGLGSLGLERARFEASGLRGRIHVGLALDSWPTATTVHEYLCPGGAGVTVDLFTRADYEAFHGEPPPADWEELTPEGLRALWEARNPGAPRPDMVFYSPPCKGYSSNLSQSKSKTPKYQALNRLVPRGIYLVQAAWPEAPPPLQIMENVPRIRTRGAEFLAHVQAQLRAGGYVLDDRDHDAGELGGLAQTRKRFLLAARQAAECPAPVHLPPRKGLKGIGEVLGQLPIPLPGAKLPPMHEVPSRQQWLTALRLALIPPGRDWRALQEVEAYAVAWHPQREIWMVAVLREGEPWRGPDAWAEGQVLGSWEREEGALLASWMTPGRRFSSFSVQDWGATSRTATTNGPTDTGAVFVADPRLPGEPWRGGYRIVPFGDSAPTVTAVHASNTGAQHVADPRLGAKNKHSSAFKPMPWEAPARTVTGAFGSGAGGATVADPRLGCKCRRGAYGVMGAADQAPTVGAWGDVHNGTVAWADPRLGGTHAYVIEEGDRGVSRAEGRKGRGSVGPRFGGVRRVRRGFSAEGPAVDSGAPHIPQPRDPGAWVILSPWDCWHRPCTTLEVAMLQGLPARVRGAPLDFYQLGLSDTDARQIIGNGVPVPAAQAIGEEFGLALLEGRGGVSLRLLLGGRWVLPVQPARPRVTLPTT